VFYEQIASNTEYTRYKKHW